MSLTIAYCTSRNSPKIEWFLDSLWLQDPGFADQIVIVDANKDQRGLVGHGFQVPIQIVAPKPTVWQGKDRLTKEDWWAVSNSRNTGLCVARGDYILWLDDRCLLGPNWLKAARAADAGKYAVCGTYVKRTGMTVEKGVIKTPGMLTATDHRLGPIFKIKRAPGQWFFGGTLGMPIEMALAINGFEELMDGLSCEDCMAGMHLENNGFQIFQDPDLAIIEDRTPGECEPVMKRSSKERWAKDTEDKGHEAFRRFGNLKRASHHWDLRAIRESVLQGHDFPHHNGQPEKDWFDGQPIAEM